MADVGGAHTWPKWSSAFIEKTHLILSALLTVAATMTKKAGVRMIVRRGLRGGLDGDELAQAETLSFVVESARRGESRNLAPQAIEVDSKPYGI